MIGTTTKNKNKIGGKKGLMNLLLLLDYIGYTNAKCNHISNVAIHVTPTFHEISNKNQYLELEK